MTNSQKIEILKRNISNAEASARRSLESGNEVGHRIHMAFADECRAELSNVKTN